MRVLLSDGTGLTSRQVATQLDTAGHVVDVLVPGGLPITRFTRHVRRVHHVPRYGTDPLAWLDAALEVARAEGIECLFPTQEQAALLARAADRLRSAGLACPVPPFSAIRAVQDKISATETLAAHGVPQPVTSVARTRAGLRDAERSDRADDARELIERRDGGTAIAHHLHRGARRRLGRVDR